MKKYIFAYKEKKEDGSVDYIGSILSLNEVKEEFICSKGVDKDIHSEEANLKYDSCFIVPAGLFQQTWNLFSNDILQSDEKHRIYLNKFDSLESFLSAVVDFEKSVVLVHKLKLADGSNAMIMDSTDKKILVNDNYNFIFNKADGFFVRFGNTQESDGDLKLGLPEILDIEISTACSGVNGRVCSFCYKANTPKGEHMTFETFQTVINKMPQSLTQVAFGIGDLPNSINDDATVGNPDMWKMMEYCRELGIIPNLTINGEGLSDDIANKLVSLVGACAVSLYDVNKTYDSVKKLTDLGLSQTNIHAFLSEESYEKCMQVMVDYKSDSRLKNLNAVVFLSLKTKGRAEKGYTQLSQEKFDALVEYAFTNNIPIGFDSCSSFKFYNAIKAKQNFKEIWSSVEPCEACCYSTYIDVKGKYAPCSFSVGADPDWDEGLNVLEAKNFLKDIWWNSKTNKWREEFISNRETKKACPFYDI